MRVEVRFGVVEAFGQIKPFTCQLRRKGHYPTDDVRLLTRLGVDALDRVYRPGFKYSKAEVLLLNLCQPGEYTDDLFAASQPAEASRVMAVLDQINGRWGKGTLRAASVPRNPNWGMRREMMSQSYTTRLDQLWKVVCS